jgi:hypothetical protein
MAIRFSHTELFRRPIAYTELRALYAEAGRGLTLQSPSQIPIQLFARLYRQGMGLPEREEAG